MTRFQGKTVIVTGAASGIGKATAERFLAEGANLVAVDIERDALHAAFANGDRVLCHVADVGDDAACKDIAEAAVARFGGIDVLVNNAGVAPEGSITKTSPADFERVLRVNVLGVFALSRHAMPYLATAKGSIVNTGSVSGLGGDWEKAAYNASKGAVTNLTRAMALDHGKQGVRVNAVAPTFTRTGMTEDYMDEKTVASFVERIPLGRIGEPEDLAAAIAFLASEDAGFISGVTLPVDGGLSASNGQPA
ncbi:SDR family oxidoreductase [Sphingomonas sp. S1-29]|uniref:SDR family NAD(P)-dependent oxidoreductase n=1 Tax=Sphingomonas sp. S1-29 TaxID=2991074 RepID=UPI002240B8E8|nr:SDR family oxidoreductase [Sphingomonas sp. S1-29]UZK70926.1 SDR family oxidoreductase [Sphingomonas sp. S1-29]